MAQLDQPCSLGPNVNPRGCLSAGGSRRLRMAASRADGQTVCGCALHCGQWGVFAALLPEPNRGPDVQKRKAQWSTSGERITSWAHFKSFPVDTQGFRFGLSFSFFFLFYPQGCTTPEWPSCCALNARTIFLFVRSWRNISCFYY